MIFRLIFCSVFLISNYEAARIIGGKPIKIEEAPYQAGLYYNDRFLCGGAVISKNFVITAAHCVNCPFCETENFNVMVGTSNRNDKNAVKIPVKKVIMHPEYSADFYSYDIAILELKDARQLPKHVLYAELPSDEIHQDDPMFITGWGRTENGLLSDVLMGVVVPVYNQTKCEEIYDEQRIEITDKMFCAGLEEGGVDSCQGDSGGPVVYKNVLYGVVNFGYGCALPNYPGVYFKVSSALDWIRENTKETN